VNLIHQNEAIEAYRFTAASRRVNAGCISGERMKPVVALLLEVLANSAPHLEVSL
jgi:hypothetical protein